MKTVTYEEFLKFEPCWLEDEEKRKQLERYGKRKKYWSALDVLMLPESEVSADHKLWAVLREEFIDAPILHEFACLCGEKALSLVENPNPKSVAAIPAKRAWLKGEISDEELADARAAAMAAAYAARATAWAAGVASWNAAGAAAWNAAWAAADAAEAAAGAASDAARAAADAAGAAVWAAARYAARAAARKVQVKMLVELINEMEGELVMGYDAETVKKPLTGEPYDELILSEREQRHLLGEGELKGYHILPGEEYCELRDAYIKLVNDKYEAEKNEPLTLDELREKSTPIEIDCRKCENCTGDACQLHGKDPKAAISKCAENVFKDYRRKPKED